ncbi:hypothetical protein D3C78_1690720 [compost metagenome]
MRPARYLHDGQRAALRGAHAAGFQGQPIDLALEYACQRAVPFRAAPDLPFGPQRQRAQFRHLGMIGGRAIGQRQATGVEDAGLGAQPRQDARGFFSQQAAI